MQTNQFTDYNHIATDFIDAFGKRYGGRTEGWITTSEHQTKTAETIMSIKFQWKTTITHPANSDGWNIQTANGDLDFDRFAAQENIERTNPSLCPHDGEVVIGKIWGVEKNDEEITL